jgi:hypothetical protein
MPIQIGELQSELHVVDGELPLSEAQLEQLVRRVIERIEARQREARWTRETTRISRRTISAFGSDEEGA